MEAGPNPFAAATRTSSSFFLPSADGADHWGCRVFAAFVTRLPEV